MGYTKWALLRTAGHLAGNYAYFEERKKQLQEEVQNILSHKPRQQMGQLDQVDLSRLVESRYGPSDLVWEAKCRAGLKVALSCLKELSRISWSQGNVDRFIELVSFVHHVHDDDDLNRHIGRFDILNPSEVSGAQIVIDCLQMSLELLRSRGDQVFPRLEVWNEWFNNNVGYEFGTGWNVAGAAVSNSDLSDIVERSRLEMWLPSSRAKKWQRLGQCSDCGGLVSVRAQFCPHCGNPSP